MEGTLVVQEERKNINKFKNWYQEKIVDTKISEGIEKGLSGFVNVTTGMNTALEAIKGGIVTVISPQLAAIFVPISAGLTALMNKIYTFEKDLIIKGKRYVEAKFIGVDGSSKDVVIPDTNYKEIEQTISGVSNNISNVMQEVELLNNGESVGKTR